MILCEPRGAAYQTLLQSQALVILVLTGGWKRSLAPTDQLMLDGTFSYRLSA